MSIERGREHLKKYGAEDRVLEFDVSSATVELAAKAVGTEGKRIAKTLSFLLNENQLQYKEQSEESLWNHLKLK